MTVRTKNTKQNEFPFVPGEEVGYRDYLATITRIRPAQRTVDLRYVTGRGTVSQVENVSIGELGAPPARAGHVEDAGSELVESGMLTDPRSAIFGES